MERTETESVYSMAGIELYAVSNGMKINSYSLTTLLFCAVQYSHHEY